MKKLSYLLILLTYLLLYSTLGWAQKPELRVQSGQADKFENVILLPDGKTFLSEGEYGTIKYWDLASGREIHTFQGHNPIPLPDSRSFLSTNNQSIDYWDLVTGKKIWTFELRNNGIHIVLLSNYKTFLCGDISGVIHIDLVTGKKIRTFEHNRDHYSQIILIPNNLSFLSVGDDDMKYYDLITGKEIRTFNVKNSKVVLSLNNRTFLTYANYSLSNSDFTIKQYDLLNGKEIRIFKGHTNSISQILFIPKTQSFLSASWDGIIKQWDLASDREIRAFKGHKYGVDKIILLPETNSFLSSDGNYIIKYWSLENGKEIRTFEGHNDWISKIIFLPKKKHFISESRDKTIKYWDLENGKEIQNFPNNYSITLLPKNSSFLSVNYNTINLLDLETGKVIQTFNENIAPINQTLILPKRHSFLSVSDSTIKEWDLQSGSIIQTFKGHSASITQITILPDNSTFLSASEDKSIKQWSLESGKEILTLNNGRDGKMNSMLLLPNEHTFLNVRGNLIEHWDLKTGKEIRTFQGHRQKITHIRLLPNAQSFLTQSSDYGDENIRHWNLKTGEEIQKSNFKKYIISNVNNISDIAFLPDSHSVLIPLSDNIHHLDLNNNSLIKSYKSNKELFEKIYLLPDSNTFLSLCSDNTKHFDLKTGEVITYFNGVGMFSEIYLSSNMLTFLSVYNGVITYWDLNTGKKIHTFHSRFGGIKSIHLLANNKQFLTINAQNSITLWDLEKHQEIVTLIPLAGDNKDYVLVSPDGRFDGTPEGMKKLLHFVVGNEVVELEQLKDRYYEPGLWKKLMGYSNEPLRNIQDIKDKGLDLYPETILKLNENKLTIKLLPRSGGVGKVSLYVGNKRVVEDINPQRKTDFTLDLKQYNKFFSLGQIDTLGIVAYEREGTLPSRPEIVEYEADIEIDFEAMEREKARQPHFYGVFIGTSNYQDGSGLRDLAYPTKDAQDLSKAMQLAAQNLLISPENVHISLLSTDDKNNLPSKANIRKILEGLAQNKDIRKEDVLVVYFSGHGVSYTVDNKDQFFYITQDLSSKNLDDKVVREAFTISTEEIAQWMVNVVARKQVLILDACASGKAVEQAQELLAKREVPTSQKRALELLKDRTGIFVISGSTSDASSYEASPYGQGFLTYALLSGITGGALQNGEYVDVMSLFQYAANRVPEIAQEFGVVQQPQIATPAKVNSFPIGKVGDKEKKAIQIAQPKPFFVRSSFFNPEENEDNLALGDLLNQSIRENMGAGRSASAIFFDVNNHPQGYKIIGNYTLKGAAIQVRWQIKNQKTNEKSKEFITEGEKTKLDELAEQIFKAALSKLGN